MIKMNTLWLVVSVISLMGCASTGFLMSKPKVVAYSKPYPAKDEESTIDIYRTSKPEVKYVELAEISCEDTNDSWNLKQILIKAREMGADGIIIIGKVDSYGVSIPIGNMSYIVNEQYGTKAIAIKYIE